LRASISPGMSLGLGLAILLCAIVWTGRSSSSR